MAGVHAQNTIACLANFIIIGQVSRSKNDDGYDKKVNGFALRIFVGGCNVNLVYDWIPAETTNTKKLRGWHQTDTFYPYQKIGVNR